MGQVDNFVAAYREKFKAALKGVGVDEEGRAFAVLEVNRKITLYPLVKTPKQNIAGSDQP